MFRSLVSDSGSRDEGIHIPRIKNVAIARSLPIEMQSKFNPSLRIFDKRFDDDDDDADTRKPNYQRKVSEHCSQTTERISLYPSSSRRLTIRFVSDEE